MLSYLQRDERAGSPALEPVLAADVRVVAGSAGEIEDLRVRMLSGPSPSYPPPLPTLTQSLSPSVLICTSP